MFLELKMGGVVWNELRGCDNNIKVRKKQSERDKDNQSDSPEDRRNNISMELC